MTFSTEAPAETAAASVYTREANLATAAALGIDPEHATNSEYELAASHLLRAADSLEVKDPDGNVIWSVPAFDFLKGDAVPDTVNPSLWVHAKTDRLAGFYSVVEDKIFQVRGFDISNLTLVRSTTGWIVVDTMTTIETSSAALDFAEEVLGEPIRDRIRAVIISHSHSDHFGGVRGVVDAERVGPASEGKVPIYVPDGFEFESVSENVYAGPAMHRRAAYQMGAHIGVHEAGVVNVGLGLGMPIGNGSYLSPTNVIEHDQTLEIDGLTVDFQLTPGTEAPAEMNNYFHDYRALWVAENCSGTLHNIYPIRGAKVRDAAGWAGYLLDAIHLYADRTDVVFQAHQWPHFNTPATPDAVVQYLTNNAAVYKYTHDQTLLYANQGLTPNEIGRTIKVPDGILKNWYVRPYYGAVEFNARAVFNRYLGFYNANPINLNPLTETDAARKFVDYVGSEELVLERAQADYDRGEYQAAAYAANQVVFANPANGEARELCASAFDQLGYQAEPSIWRNAYLQGAKELRAGTQPSPRGLANPDLVAAMSPRLLVDYLGILIDGERAGEEDFRFQLEVSEAGKPTVAFDLHLYHGALLATDAEVGAPTQRYARLTKAELGGLLRGASPAPSADTNVQELLERLAGYVVDLTQHAAFAIVEP